MVDALASHLATRQKINAATAVAGGSFSFAATTIEADDYASCCDDAVFAPAQSPAWVAAWLRNVRPDAFIVTVSDAGRPILSAALEIESVGPFKIARLVGKGHANGNFPPTVRALTPERHQSAVAAMTKHIAGARPDVDLLALERLAPEWQGIANPLRVLPHSTSPNIALAVDLSGGFDAVLTRTHGSKKKKKHRYQTRRLQTAGEIRLLAAKTPVDTLRMLDAFFDMKSARLKRLGVANVFGPRDVQAFFKDLFAGSASDREPAFILNALEVGGELRAITGSSRSGNRLICDFAAIANDELTGSSPGDYLFFENISAACHDGLAIYDFGVGDEPYKRSWCNIETPHLDVWMPLTSRGKLLAATLSAKARLKAQVKHSPAAWRLWKALRSRLRRVDLAG